MTILEAVNMVFDSTFFLAMMCLSVFWIWTLAHVTMNRVIAWHKG